MHRNYLRLNKESSLSSLVYSALPFSTILLIKLNVWSTSSDALYPGSVLVLILSLVAAYRIYKLESQNRFKELSIQAIDGLAGVMVLDKSLTVKYVNKQFSRITGYSSSQAIHARLTDLPFLNDAPLFSSIKTSLKIDDHWSGEFSGSGQFGRTFSVMLYIQKLTNRFGKSDQFVLTFTDISKLKQTQRKLVSLTERDPLTNVWNRRRFDNTLKKLVHQSEESQQNQSCLTIIDIDHFKRVNDEHGHDHGDAVLKEIANILSTNSRSTDVVSRIGGEEFAILMPSTKLNHAVETVKRIKSAVEESTKINTTVSCGVSPILQRPEDTFRAADQALYQAKKLGRNRVILADIGA